MAKYRWIKKGPVDISLTENCTIVLLQGEIVIAGEYITDPYVAVEVEIENIERLTLTLKDQTAVVMITRKRGLEQSDG
jgi:hypothetical protein